MHSIYMLSIDSKEIEAVAVAKERGYALNAWRLHGRELDRIYTAICDALTWGQFKRWQENAPADYRRRFQGVARVTRSKKILALAAYGLTLVVRCEALTTKTET